MSPVIKSRTIGIDLSYVSIDTAIANLQELKDKIGGDAVIELDERYGSCDVSVRYTTEETKAERLQRLEQENRFSFGGVRNNTRN